MRQIKYSTIDRLPDYSIYFVQVDIRDHHSEFSGIAEIENSLAEVWAFS